MAAQRGISRRDLLTGAFRGRNIALAGTGALVWSHLLARSTGASGQLRPPGARREDEFLAAMVLSKVATALRAPGRMDLPTVQVSER